MAGDWMKIELELPDKPEVHGIAATLNIDPDAVVGKLIRIWQWFDKHTVDGNAYGVTYSLLDRITGVTGFGEAMSFVGWIEQKDKYLVMPKFDRHTSKSAKSRAVTSSRVKRHRNGNATLDVTLVALPREEKRRDKNKGEIQLPECVSESVWTEWTEYRRERKLTCSEKTLSAQLAKLTEWSAKGYDANEIIRSSIANGWQGLFEPKTKPTLKPVPAGDPNEIITLPDGRQITKAHQDFLRRMSA